MYDNFITINDKSYDLKILLDLSNKKLDLSEFDQKIDAHLRSFQTAGIDISRFYFRSLFSNKQFLIDHQERKNAKLLELFKEVQDLDILDFYEKFRPFVKFLYNINNQTLITDL